LGESSEGAQSTTFETIGFEQIIRGAVLNVLPVRGGIPFSVDLVQQVESHLDVFRLFRNDDGGFCE
jgi:hypothetical protein